MDRRTITSFAANSKRFRLSYEYKLLVISLVITTIVIGVTSSFGVFFKPIRNEFGWTYAATSGSYSLSAILFGLSGLAFGRVSDRFRFGTRMVVTVCGIFFGAGTMLMSQTVNLGQLYLFYGVLGGIGQGGIFTSLLSLVSRWFTRRLAFANGIVMCGVGLGTAIVPLVATQIMEVFDWRVSLIIVGGVTLVTLVILAQFIKGKTDNIGTTDLGNSPKGAEPRGGMLSLREALSTRLFWMIFTAWFLYGFYNQVAMVHIVPYAIGVGMSATAAASLLTVIGVSGIIGRLIMGFAGDKSSKENIVIVALLSMAAVYLGLSGSGTIWMLYLFAVIFGFFVGIGFLMPPIIAERFGLTALGTIFGAVLLANNLGGAAGPVVAGDMFDKSGTYTPAFIVCGIVGILAGLITWLSKRRA